MVVEEGGQGRGRNQQASQSSDTARNITHQFFGIPSLRSLTFACLGCLNSQNVVLTLFGRG